MSQTVQIYIKQRKTRNEKIHRHKSLSLFQMNHIRLQSKVSSFTSWKALSTNGSLKKKKKKRKGKGDKGERQNEKKTRRRRRKNVGTKEREKEEEPDEKAVKKKKK